MLTVALRKESVDRNKKMFDQIMQGDPSLSARRAWIEIGVMTFGPGEVFVALRKESVDRNQNILCNMHKSPVALRKESVDRNFVHMLEGSVCFGRSPQGERG